MYITKILNSRGNDFSAQLECEHCRHQQELKYGYHDAHYHDKVIPAITCMHCKKNRAGDTPEIENPYGTVHVP